MTHRTSFPSPIIPFAFALFIALSACEKSPAPPDPATASGAVLLVIDEESIDNGNPPNNFSGADVNDPLADVGLRTPLKYFAENVGKTIDLYTGDVGDEGWHALKTIPSTWVGAGPLPLGAQNFFAAGPGLGTSNGTGDREALLDKIPDVTPLRGAGLTMLSGQTVLAVVYDSDISTNYSPLQASLKGANLGVVAFDVLQVTARTDGSTSSLPRVTVRIRAVTEAAALPFVLFANAPSPQSSSVPMDVAPPVAAPAIELVSAP